MRPNVSIIICTRDRADSLRETLESVGRARVPEDLPAELLVVDNGSTDHTRQVVEQAGLTNMPVRYVHEPQRGLSNARNRALAESAGDILLWTDDDVRVPEDWIEGMCRPIASGEADAVAGSIRLAGGLLAEWMEPLHVSWLAHRDHQRNQSSGFDLVGANMAFHRRVAQATSGFSTVLGAGAMGFGEDTFVGLQARAAGLRLTTSPVQVEHHPDPARLARHYWLNAARKRGASTAYIDYHWSCIRSASLRKLVRAALRYLWWWVRHPEWQRWKEGAATAQLLLLSDVHYELQLWRMRREPRRYARDGGARPRTAEAPALTGAGERHCD